MENEKGGGESRSSRRKSTPRTAKKNSTQSATGKENVPMEDQNNGHVSEVSKASEALQHNAEKLATDANQSVAEARRTLRRNATAAKEKASDSLLSAAEAIRNEALKGGNDEVIRQSHTIARSMEKAALYLDSRTIDQLGEDATKVVKENVWPSLGIVFVVGLLMGILFGGHRD